MARLMRTASKSVCFALLPHQNTEMRLTDGGTSFPPRPLRISLCRTQAVQDPQVDILGSPTIETSSSPNPDRPALYKDSHPCESPSCIMCRLGHRQFSSQELDGNIHQKSGDVFVVTNEQDERSSTFGLF